MVCPLVLHAVRHCAMKVNAVEDVGENTAIRYSLEAGNIERFRIDENSGVITTNASLDREEQDRYVLTVQATDMAAQPLSSFVQVNNLE